MESKSTKSQATNEKDSKKYSETSTKTQGARDLDSKKSKTPTAEVFLDNFKGCADSCARSLLDINDGAQEANSLKQTFLESAKKTMQNPDSKTTTCHIERSEISHTESKRDFPPTTHTTHKDLDSIENTAKKDRIFLQDFTQPMPKFEFNEMVASVFDDMLERSIPFYDEVMNLAIFFIKEHLQTTIQHTKEIPVIYDLGSSTGNLLLKLAANLEECKIKAHLYGVDNALAMIERAQLKSAAMGFNINFLQADFLTFDFKPTHVFLAFYTMQFVRPLQRKDMIQKIYDCLNENGIFLFAEKVISDDSRLEGQMIECYYDYKAKQGYTHKEIYKKREALENVLVPYSVSENCMMLKSCGFKHVEILFKWVNFTLFLARK